jgi:hypothetical protein
VANYGVDIEVALKGVEKLRQFDKLISHSVDELNKLEKALKNVNKQNPYDVAGARRVTELDKKRTDFIRQQNRLLSEQERHRRTIASEAARANLLDQAAARRAGVGGIQRRPIAGVAYPQGAGPGEGPQAAFNRQMAQERQAALGRRKVNDIKQATRFLEIDLINKQIQLEVDGIERIGNRQAENNKNWLTDWGKRFKSRQEEKKEALAIAKIEADAATKRRKAEQQLVAQRSKRRQEVLSSALIGGAFPLLFGQGIGAAAGGAAGGGLGGLAGGQLGFGLSLVGTALGSAFDQLAQGAKESAAALRDPITNFEQIKSKSILASASQERYIETLIKTGQFTKAATEIQQEVIKKVGLNGVRDFQNLEVAQTKLSRATGEFVLQLQAALAGPLTDLTSWLAGFLAVANTARSARMVTEGAVPTDPAERARFEKEVLKSYNKVFGTQFTSAKQGRGQLEGQSGFLGYLSSSAAGRQELARIQEMFPAGGAEAQLTAEAAQRQKIYKGTTAEMQLQSQLAEKQLVIARQNGTVSAAARALAAQAANDIEYEIAKLGIKNQMLREGFDLERNQALHRQAALNHQARQAAIAEQQRQQELADLQQRISLTAQSLQLSAQAHSLDEQIRSLGVTQEKALENKLLSLKEQHSFQSLALQMEHEAARLSDDYLKNQKEINENHKVQTDNLARQQNLELAQISRQRELLALTRMRSDHERQLQFAQTQAGFQSQLAGAGISPFVGPFSESARAEQQMALDFALEIKNKQLEIQQLTDEMRIADDEERKQLEDRRQGLQNLLNLYREYQPQINAATLEQQRFNEALQFTQPVVDGVFQSLTAVADGTKTAQQAFADFLMTIANMLVDVAAQMIATYIAIGIARSFAGVPSGEKASIPGSIGTMTNGAVVTPTGFQGQFGGFAANGGQIQGGKSYIVGERGPELFTPGASGFVTPNHALGMGGSNNIVVNVDATGTQVQGDQPNANKLGEALGAAVRAELLRQKRPGGLLA